MQLADSLQLAWSTIKSNKLRTGITVSIIAIGIMALIGILTATAAMNQSLRESFSTMGANSFSIRFRERQIRLGNDDNAVNKTKKSKLKERKSNTGRTISYEEAKAFKEQYNFPAQVSISLRGNFAAKAVYNNGKKNKETNPNVSFIGGDENYLLLNGYTILNGRNFSESEVFSGAATCIIGADIVYKIFNDKPESALGKTIKIDNFNHLIIGTMKSRGSSAFLSLDNIIITTFNNVRRLPVHGQSFAIGVHVADFSQMDAAIGQATGAMRPIRKLEIEEKDNFYIDKSDALAETFIGFLSGISGAAGVIGFITLVGAAIGLMNIMLVAVTERTKEVGLSKAMGATQKAIQQQFLFESIIISLLGAVFGILAGVIVGNLFGIILNTGFIIPWFWVVMGVVICFITGLLAGFYPARKAAKLDPIVALRYE